MKTLTSFGKRPSYLPSDEALEMKLKILLQTLSNENSKENLNTQALISLLWTIQERFELTKGYLAALAGTSQRISSRHYLCPLDAKEVMAHHSLILSECLGMVWSATTGVEKLISSLSDCKKDQESVLS